MPHYEPHEITDLLRRIQVLENLIGSLIQGPPGRLAGVGDHHRWSFGSTDSDQTDLYYWDGSEMVPSGSVVSVYSRPSGARSVRYHPTAERWYIEDAAVSVQSFVFRTDLVAGGLAVVEKTAWRLSYDYCYYDSNDEAIEPPYREKKLCWTYPKRTFHWAFDRLNEFEGSKDLHCGICHILEDTPTWSELCLAEGRPTWFSPTSGGEDIEWNEELHEWDDRVWEIQRVVCANFTGCGCVLSDPCVYGVY